MQKVSKRFLITLIHLRELCFPYSLKAMFCRDLRFQAVLCILVAKDLRFTLRVKINPLAQGSLLRFKSVRCNISKSSKLFWFIGSFDIQEIINLNPGSDPLFLQGSKIFIFIQRPVGLRSELGF